MSLKRKRAYLPPLRYAWLTSFYDPLVRVVLRERTFKGRLVNAATIRPGDRVLDLGCGTATLSLMLKAAHPTAAVFGLDADWKALTLGRVKAMKGPVTSLVRGTALNLPFRNDSFDTIVFSLGEVFRVLKRGGELVVADWGRPQNLLMRAPFLAVRLLDGFENTSDNVRGLLPALFREAGFEEISEFHRYATLFGSLSLYRARKPK